MACAKRRDEKVAKTTAKLIEAAREAFREQGYAGASMDELCRRAGLTRGALYHHFGSKEGLLEAVVQQIHCEMGQVLDATFRAEPKKWVAFRTCCRRYLEMALDPEIQRIVFRDAPAVLGERLRQMEVESRNEIIAAIRDVMEEGHIPPSDPEPLGVLLDGAMADAALWIASTADPRATFDRAVRALDLLLDGLEARPR